MDDSRVSAVHLARLDRHTLFLCVCSGFLPLFLGWSYYPKEEVDVTQTYLWCCTEREGKRSKRQSGKVNIMEISWLCLSRANGCIPRARLGMNPCITASMSSVFCPSRKMTNIILTPLLSTLSHTIGSSLWECKVNATVSLRMYGGYCIWVLLYGPCDTDFSFF